MSPTMVLKIQERQYDLDIRKLKLKALQALQNFQASEELSELIDLIALVLNEPDKAFLTEEVTVGHIMQIKDWTEALNKGINK